MVLVRALHYGQRVALATCCTSANVEGVYGDHPTPDYKSLGVMVARLRRERGWSIDRLAEAAHVARRSVINVEGGHHPARIETLWGIAHGLDVPVGDLADALYGTEGRRDSQ